MNPLAMLLLVVCAAMAMVAAVHTMRLVQQYVALYADKPHGMHPKDLRVWSSVASVMREILTRLLMLRMVLTRKHLVVLTYDAENQTAYGPCTRANDRALISPPRLNLSGGGLARQFFLNDNEDTENNHQPSIEAEDPS